jgi:glycolate oxidase
MPSAVAIPDSIEELRSLVQVAYENSIPIIPACFMTNMGGLCNPSSVQEVIVELSRINRIECINEKDMIAVIQPGVTWAGLAHELNHLRPPLGFSYPLAPVYSSVLACCILDGLGSLSLNHGTLSELVGGMEVLLPNGSFVKTGMGAIFPSNPNFWLTRAPLPDIGGLFIGWQGTTGIVTKLSIQLWEKPELKKRFFLLFEKAEDGIETLSSLSRHFGLCEDLAGISWPASRYLFGIFDKMKLTSGDYEFFAYVDIGGKSHEEIMWKEREVGIKISHMEKTSKRKTTKVNIEDLIKIAPSLKPFSVQPTTLNFLINHPYGGITWVGAYGPVSKLSEGVKEVTGIMEKAGFPPFFVSRPMKGGHFSVLRFISFFKKNDEDERKRVRNLNMEIVEKLLDSGFVPYKIPPWAWSKLLEKMDEGAKNLMKKVREIFDPHGIMNQNKLALK